MSAIPSKRKIKKLEATASTTNNKASKPIRRSKGVFFTVNPMINNPIARNTKKVADVRKWMVKIVSGNKPIPIRATELTIRKYAPVLLDRILINPRENIKVRIPARINPLLNKSAVFCWIPRSLSAFSVHINQGDKEREIPSVTKITKGSKIPQAPAMRMIPVDLHLKPRHIISTVCFNNIYNFSF